MFNGELLADLRARKKLTQQQLADKLGVSRRNVVRWENGEVCPGAETIKELSKIFHIKMEVLLK